MSGGLYFCIFVPPKVSFSLIWNVFLLDGGGSFFLAVAIPCCFPIDPGWSFSPSDSAQPLLGLLPGVSFSFLHPALLFLPLVQLVGGGSSSFFVLNPVSSFPIVSFFLCFLLPSTTFQFFRRLAGVFVIFTALF